MKLSSRLTMDTKFDLVCHFIIYLILRWSSTSNTYLTCKDPFKIFCLILLSPILCCCCCCCITMRWDYFDSFDIWSYILRFHSTNFVMLQVTCMQ
jgi:hypothetical protein